MLSEKKTLDPSLRAGYRNTAAVEFEKEIARLKAQPVSDEPQAKKAREQEELYLNLCLKAVSPLIK